MIAEVVVWCSTNSAAFCRGLVSCLIAVCGVLPRPVSADTFVGEVVALADGDTVTVLDLKHRQRIVRLAGIDAPESRQPFGQRARQALAAQVFRRTVSVEWHKNDRYGRIVGVVKVAGNDVGLELIRLGLAWHYKQYQHEQLNSDRMLYSAAEVEARLAKRGLWEAPAPLPPWEFRRRRHAN